MLTRELYRATSYPHPESRLYPILKLSYILAMFVSLSPHGVPLTSSPLPQNYYWDCCNFCPHYSGFTTVLPLSPSRLTLTSIQPASRWMHWTTFWCHSDKFWAATCASSQVIPILSKSLLTMLLQFVCRRPGPLLNPGTSQCNTCRGMCWWSIHITCPS